MQSAMHHMAQSSDTMSELWLVIMKPCQNSAKASLGFITLSKARQRPTGADIRTGVGSALPTAATDAAGNGVTMTPLLTWP